MLKKILIKVITVGLSRSPGWRGRGAVRLIKYVARKEPFMAKVEVFVDGVCRGVFDLSAPQLTNQQVIFDDAGLSLAEHTVRLVNAGTKNPDSQGSLINIDYLEYTW